MGTSSAVVTELLGPIQNAEEDEIERRGSEMEEFHEKTDLIRREIRLKLRLH